MATVKKKSEIQIKCEQICRTCLSKENEQYSIFDILIGTITIDYIVTSITGLKVMTVLIQKYCCYLFLLA